MSALNDCDPDFTLGMVECDIVFDHPENQICPLISHTMNGRLEYTFEQNQRVRKTTIDIMEAVKYNHASVFQVFTAMLWTDRAPILREGTEKICSHRAKQRRKGMNQ
jgi:hypothetical protein